MSKPTSVCEPLGNYVYRGMEGGRPFHYPSYIRMSLLFVVNELTVCENVIPLSPSEPIKRRVGWSA